MAGRAVELLRAVGGSCACPAHSNWCGRSNQLIRLPAGTAACKQHSADSKEYAFEMACSSVRYGEGVTGEVGMDFANLRTKRVLVLTDRNLARLSPLKVALGSLHSSKVEHTVYEDVSIEPTNESYEDVIELVRCKPFDGFLAVGGGSVMDTAKVANLFSCCPDNQLLDFVNQPIGRGLPVTTPLKPLICVPTTAGTGSETTGVSIFDHKPLRAKTGIAHRSLRPLLGLIDPLHTLHMPKNVAAFSGFDVLCHALESYTALPYKERQPRPLNPINRPAYQGSNPISDVWARSALSMIQRFFKRAVLDAGDLEARSAMHLASASAGIGFGNAGVHLPHGMSYAISGLARSFSSEGYSPSKSLVPHGLSVVISAPAVFQFTAAACPERHLEAAMLLGADTSRAKLADAGRVLADTLRGYMHELGVADGLRALGYGEGDIPALVQSTLPQHRVTKLSPQSFSEEQLSQLFRSSMTVY